MTRMEVAVRRLTGASVLCYTAALLLPAYKEGGGALDGYVRLNGIECLLTPITVHPLILIVYPSWWANPLYFGAIAAAWLRNRRGTLSASGMGVLLDVASVVAGGTAAVLAALFPLQVSAFAGPLNPDRLRVGCWVWCVAMGLLAAARAVALSAECRQMAAGEREAPVPGGGSGPSEALPGHLIPRSETDEGHKGRGGFGRRFAWVVLLGVFLLVAALLTMLGR